jgi:hypothetical protein
MLCLLSQRPFEAKAIAASERCRPYRPTLRCVPESAGSTISSCIGPAPVNAEKASVRIL